MPLTTNIHAPLSQVTVSTSARLHMGFYDLCGQFGSLGLSIDYPNTIISLVKSEKLLIDVKSNQNSIKIVKNLVKALNLNMPFALTINEAMPAHIGFGSGTQMALAIGAGLNQLFGLNLSVPQIAAAANRGARSGIGVAAFMQGGVLVDTGKINNSLPKIALRQSFPDDWRVLIITDSAHIGVHDTAEFQAFKTLKPAQNSLREMVFNHMLPALQHNDLLAFGAYMQDLQAYNGDYFAPVQGGRYASQDVAQVLSWLKANGAACVGQSSWGPTGFAIFNSAEYAEALQKQAQIAFASKQNISFSISRGNNNGATIDSC